ncbi:MAG: hypothetical protein DWP97_06465 [Calditrichaeota bacterium]|nr:MAG: hypothetical protein DWP97_06465 [Calditrichota bacterium]
MANKKLLLISYYFPPFGGAGSGRPYGLFRHLPEFGIDVDILTVKPIASRSFDYSLLNKTDESRIYRSKSFDPQRIMYLFGMRTLKDKTIGKGKTASDRFFPDSKIGWVKQAVKLGRILIENKKYDTIMSTSPSISSHLVGMKLAGEFNLKWIADFRDYWTSYKPESWYDSKSQVEKAYKLIAEITKKADAVTTVSKSIGNFLGTKDIIQNSYNTELANLWSSPKTTDRFVVGLLGTIDKLTIVEPLLKMLSKLKGTEAELFAKIKVIQVGQIHDPDFEKKLSEYNLSETIEINNFQERKTTIEMLNDSHLLYLGLNPEFEEGMLTSRVFEMIASGRPILGYTTKESELGCLIQDVKNGITFQDDTIDVGVTYLKKNIEDWQNSKLTIIPNDTYALPYSSVEMAKKVSEIIKNIL